MNFSFIDESVSGTAGPLSLKEVNWLRNAKGIQAILSVKEGPLSSGWVEGVQYLNVIVKNHAIPTIEQLITCVDFLISQVSSGHKTSVHCAAGKGRTGTVLAAYLCKRYDLNPDAAIGKIRSMRPGSIEKKQEAAIYAYFEERRKSKKVAGSGSLHDRT